MTLNPENTETRGDVEHSHRSRCSLPLAVPTKAGYATIPFGISQQYYDLLIDTLLLWKPILVENEPEEGKEPEYFI